MRHKKDNNGDNMTNINLDLYYQVAFNSNWLTLLADLADEIDFDWQLQDAGITFSDHVEALRPALDGKPFTYQVPSELTRGNAKVSIHIQGASYQGLSAKFPKVTILQEGKDPYPLTYLWSEFKKRFQIWAALSHDQRPGYQQRAIERASFTPKNKKQPAEFTLDPIELHRAYRQFFKNAPLLSASHPYVASKQVGKIAPLFNLRQADDVALRQQFAAPHKRKHINSWGEAILVPLRTLANNYVGFQRIYDKAKMPAGFDNKHILEKLHDGAYDAAFFPMGQLVNGQPIAVAEGWATAATIFLLGKESCVLFALNSGNLKKVVAQLVAHYPDSPIHIYADNDHKKPDAGNVGLKTAYELLEKHKSRVKAYIPKISHLPADVRKKITDYNDLAVFAGESEARAQLTHKRNEIKPPENLFHHSLRMLVTMPSKNGLDRQLRDCLRIGMADVPAKRGVDEVVLQISHWLEKAKIRADFDFKKAAAKMYNGKMHRAMVARSIDAKHKAQAASYKAFEKTKVDGDVINYVKGLDGIVIFRSGMASRKTSMLIKAMMQGHGQFAYIAHRVSLIGAAASELNYSPTDAEKQQGFIDKAGIYHYQDDIAMVKHGGIDKLACCINSITKPVFAEFFANLDGLFIDEASQTLRHLMGRGVDNPKLVEQKLLNSIKNCTGPVVLCDADADTELFRYFKKSCPDKAIHIVELQADCSNLSASYTDAARVWQMVLDDLSAGKKVILATDNATWGQDLIQAVQAQFPNKKTLLICSDTNGEPTVKQFQDNPNKHLSEKIADKNGKTANSNSKQQQARQRNRQANRQRKNNYDLLIYSPAISSGVSITVKAFDKAYGVFKGIIVPSDAVQMLRRYRLATDFVIGFDGNHGSRQTDHDSLLRGHLAAEGLAEQSKIDWDRRLVLAQHFTLFDETKCRLEALDNRQRNDFANNMILQMQHDGWQLQRLADDENASAEGKAARKAQSEMRREADWLAIDQTPRIDDCKAKALVAKKAATGLTVEEKRLLERYQVESGLQEDLSRENWTEFKGGILGKLRRLELMTMTEQQAGEFDKLERLAGVPVSERVQARSAHQFFSKCWQMIGLDPVSGEGVARTENLRAWRDWLHQPDVIDLANRRYFGVGRLLTDHTRDLCPTALLKSFVARFGLAVEKGKRQRFGGVNAEVVRRLDPQKVEQQHQRLARRLAAGISAYSPDKAGAGVSDCVTHFAADCIPTTTTDHTQKQETWDQAIHRVITGLQATQRWLTHPYAYIRSRFTQAERTLYDDGRLTIFDMASKIHQLLAPPQ